MSSDKRLCRCRRCLLVNPAGQLLSSSYVSRHAKEEEREVRTASALDAIKGVEQEIAAKTVTMAVPGLRQYYREELVTNLSVSRAPVNGMAHTDGCGAGEQPNEGTASLSLSSTR